MTSAMLLAVVMLCGTERVDVKDLYDPAAAKVSATPKDGTVEDLAAFPMPPWSNTRPRDDNETVTYRITAKVVGFKLESDGDFHVVIQGDTGKTMVVEFPDPACAKSPAVVQRFTKARANFLREFMQPTVSYKKVKQPKAYVLTGVAYWDKHMPGHIPTGSADNGVEIHPADIAPVTP